MSSNLEQQAVRRSVTAPLRMPDPADLPPAEAVNWFNFTWVTDQVQLVIGYIDIQNMAMVAQGRSKGPIVPDVRARLALTPSSFAVLHRHVLALASAMKAHGLPLEDMAEAGPINVSNVTNVTR